jgi:hypothetical protein
MKGRRCRHERKTYGKALQSKPQTIADDRRRDGSNKCRNVAARATFTASNKIKE